MAKLKIKLTRATLKGLCAFFFSSLRVALVNDLYKAADYLHYYNAKTLQKKLIVKQMNAAHTKNCTLSLTVNEYEAFKWLYGNTSHCITLDAYYSVVVLEIFTELHKQEIAISHPSNFQLI